MITAIGISGVFMLIIILLVFAITFSVTYFLIYQRKVNLRLRQGGTGWRMPAPRVLIIVAFFVLLVITSVLLSLAKSHQEQDSFKQVEIPEMQATVYLPEEIPGTYAAIYQKEEEIEGYNKYVKEDEDFVYRYYISKEEYDILHPKFIMFAEYKGKEIYYRYSSEFWEDEGNGLGTAGGGKEMPEYFCVVGNVSGPCTYQFQVDTFTEDGYEKVLAAEGESEATETYAQSTSKLEIELDYGGDEIERGACSLEDISIDGIRIGDSIEQVDLSKYHKSDRYSGDYKYKFDELVIDTDENGIIKYLFAYFNEDVEIAIGDERKLQDIDYVKYLLGDQCEVSTYDSELSLQECRYEDVASGQSASFMYYEFVGATGTYDRKVSFVKMSKS